MARTIHDLIHQQQASQSPPLSLSPDQLDLRTAERIPLAVHITYHMEAVDAPLDGAAMTINLSGGGAHFAIPRMVPPQTPCHLRLLLPGEPDPLILVGRVVWCRQGRGRYRKQYELGVAFAPPASEHDTTFIRYAHFIAAQLLAKYLR